MNGLWNGGGESPCRLAGQISERLSPSLPIAAPTIPRTGEDGDREWLAGQTGQTGQTGACGRLTLVRAALHRRL
jgi:hypothetical protein